MSKTNMFYELPHDILENITSRLDPTALQTMRRVSWSTRVRIPDPVGKERVQISKLVKLFKKAESSCLNGANFRGDSGNYGIDVRDGDSEWRVILRYKYSYHPYWKYLTVCKLGENRVIEGAIQMDFENNRLRSYKTGEKHGLLHSS